MPKVRVGKGDSFRPVSSYIGMQADVLVPRVLLGLDELNDPSPVCKSFIYRNINIIIVADNMSALLKSLIIFPRQKQFLTSLSSSSFSAKNGGDSAPKLISRKLNFHLDSS